MIKGKTSSGFEFELEDEVLDDYDLLESLQKADEGDAGSMLRVVDILLGEEQKRKLKDHVRSDKGRVSAKALFAVVEEIFQACKEGKN